MVLIVAQYTARLSAMSTPFVTAPKAVTSTAWIEDSDCRLDDFRAEGLRHTDLADYPHAHDVHAGVLVYSAASIGKADRRLLQGELIHALADGPGVVVIEGAFTDAVVDAASAAFRDLIAAQRAEGSAAGDHFGKPGAN